MAAAVINAINTATEKAFFIIKSILGYNNMITKFYQKIYWQLRVALLHDY